MRVTILGSGTLLPDPDHHSAAHVVEEGEVRVLFDCGSGTVHGAATHGIRWRELTHIALSHFHTDHVGDLAALLFAFKHGIGSPVARGPLTLLGPPGLEELVENLARAHGSFIREPGVALEVRELSRNGDWPDPRGRFRLRSAPALHTDHSVAYRFDGRGGTFGYTGDTGFAPELAEFLEGADVLVAECGQADPPERDNHLTPGGVAKLASAAGPGVVVTTHVYPPLVPEEVPRRIREAGYEGRVVAGRDGLVLEVEGGAVRIQRRPDV